MSTNVPELAGELIAALNVVMDVNASREHRARANQLLEEFKESSLLCAHCGFYMASQNNPPTVRHFGLLLMEHCIQHKWNATALDQKIFIKENLMKMLANGTLGILEEHYHIKNALAKNVVEIIKREWPQQWPGMLNELYHLSNLGETQTELVLLIFMRLAEDVVGLQIVHVQRRRDIYQGLTSNLKDIFNFFTDVLQKNIAEYMRWKQMLDSMSPMKINIHSQVAKATLDTLVEYLEWISVTHLLANNGVLLQIICGLLEDDILKYSAVECLLAITGRRGKPEDRKPLLMLFESDSMATMLKAARYASDGPIVEKSYSFLKRICQVFINLGNLLCALWGSNADIESLPNFAPYLEAMLSLTGHPSHTLSNFAVSIWLAFFRHEHMSKHPKLLSFIPLIVEPLSKKLIKVGFPSRTDSPSCAFARLDFDNDEEFNSFFLKFRNECSEVMRQATALAPSVTFECVVRWLEVQLQKPIEIGESDGSGISCTTLYSPSYLEWDALTVSLESVLSRIHQMNILEPFVDVGIRLLERVLLLYTQDPNILSATLSCISAFFVFLTFAPQTLPSVLDRIFATLIFSLPGQTKASRSRAVKNVRRHACSCLVKLCKLYPKLLVTSFDKIYELVGKLSNDPQQLSQMERCTLTEALLLISNELESVDKRASFLKEVLNPVSATLLLSDDFKIALSSPNHFMTHIGLNLPPVEPSVDDLHGINRSKILECVYVILAIIKRSKICSESDGAFDCNTPSTYIPTLDFLLPFFEPIYQLVRIFNCLFIPDVHATVSPQYAKANDMLECGKNNVLGISTPCIDVGDVPLAKHPLERMQNFLTNVHDVCYHILGNACLVFGKRFYCIPSLVHFIRQSIFPNIKWIPDYRLRPVINNVRVFMKPFIQCCPQELLQVCVIPVLQLLCPFMYQRLNEKWANLECRLSNRYCEDDNMEQQEVLEEQLHRQITREYMSLLVVAIQGKKGQFSFGEMMEEEDNCPSSTNMEGIGDLGQLIFKFEDLYPSVVLTIFSALSWNDATTSLKASQLCIPVIRQLHVESKLGLDETQYLFKCILMGLQQHGQHESNVNFLLVVGLQAYEIMRPLHSTFIKVMLEVPNCTEKDIQAFDEKISSANPRKKKDMFRSLVSDLIGKSIGEMFSRKVVIKDLPPMLRPRKVQQAALEDIETKDLGLCQLFIPQLSNATNIVSQ